MVRYIYKEGHASFLSARKMCKVKSSGSTTESKLVMFSHVTVRNVCWAKLLFTTLWLEIKLHNFYYHFSIFFFFSTYCIYEQLWPNSGIVFYRPYYNFCNFTCVTCKLLEHLLGLDPLHVEQFFSSQRFI